MNYWRMAMKIGNQGPSQFEDCYDLGIAAIGYYDKNDNPVIDDCRRYSEDEYNEIWRKKRPHWSAPRTSLRNVAYRMKKGDIIYVKDGSDIIGKGEILKGYDFDPDILRGKKQPWEHFVKVKWERNFVPFTLRLGLEQYTVIKLEDKKLKKIKLKDKQSKKQLKEFTVKEGKISRKEVLFRQRNRALIELKKRSSDYRCEVCELNFKERYGDIGDKYIVAHHEFTMGRRKRSSKTSLKDIALVCSNCHDMLHRKDPPYNINQMRRKLL